MPTCLKCSQHFPNRLRIEGRLHILKNRKYCLTCSPFGMKNRRRLHQQPQDRICKECGRIIPSQAKCGNKCHTCWMHKRQIIREKQLYDITGRACWICGYDKGTYMLDFHHIDPSQKLFCLNRKTIAGLKWTTVLAEAKKCALLCCRCHREVEYDFISQEIVIAAYQANWQWRGRQEAKAAES